MGFRKTGRVDAPAVALHTVRRCKQRVRMGKVSGPTIRPRPDLLYMDTPWQRYQADLKQDNFLHDAAQENAVSLLERLYQRLLAVPGEPRGGLRGWVRRLRNEPVEPVIGLYLWGGVRPTSWIPFSIACRSSASCECISTGSCSASTPIWEGSKAKKTRSIL